MDREIQESELASAFPEWLAEQMPGGFFIYRADENQKIMYINRAAMAIFGCDSLEQFRELTGGTFSGMIHPEDREAVLDSIESQISDSANGNLDAVEYRILRRDGAVRYVDDYGRYLKLPDMEPVYYVFIGDITEKRRIREENSRAAAVIEGLSEDYSSIYLLDLDSGSMRPYRQKNAVLGQFVRELGSEDGGCADWRQVLPAYGQRFVLPEDREFFLREVSEDRLRERLKNEHAFTVNYRRGGEGEETVYFSMSVVCISESDRDGAVLGFREGGRRRRAVLGFRDVTADTLAIQRELAEKLRTELELEREKHLNEIRSQFLFQVSHDIRTPMNAILGFAGLAKKHIDDRQRLLTDLERVEESGGLLLELIDDLLDMSRLESGKVEMKTEPCDLGEQIGLTMDLFRAQAEEKGLTLRCAPELPEGQVLADAGRFRRILGNLLSNAVKFTPAGGTVTVSAKRTQASDSGYGRYAFTVADTGVGMTGDFMQRMYRAFERECTSTETGTKGTGLGLAIVKSLVDLMGGTVSAHSEKGKGSSFTVELPLKSAPGAGDSSAPAEAADTEPESYRACGPHRVLLVEDIEINRMLAETILEEAGFQVESVPDGCDAVEAVRTHPAWYYDLVLMDIQMPVMNGYEATRAIRAMDREDIPSLPIIALSANARDEDRRQSVESGMNNHVSKPFDVANLISTINCHIEGRIKAGP